MNVNARISFLIAKSWHLNTGTPQLVWISNVVPNVGPECVILNILERSAKGRAIQIVVVSRAFLPCERYLFGINLTSSVISRYSDWFQYHFSSNDNNSFHYHNNYNNYYDYDYHHDYNNDHEDHNADNYNIRYRITEALFEYLDFFPLNMYYVVYSDHSTAYFILQAWY